MSARRPVIGVIGSGTKPYPELSQPLGVHIAEQGYHLINGGGAGVMRETAEAYQSVSPRKGSVIGILPSQGSCTTPEERGQYRSPSNYPNDAIDLAIFTHLPDSGPQGKLPTSRNHIIVLSADVIVGLPGGPGTRSEIELALEYGRRLILINHQGVWQDFQSTAAILVKTADQAIAKLAELPGG